MKKVFNLRTIFMVCILAVFASCSKDSADGNPESAPGAESQVARYTVMFYGCGGKSLDENLIQDIDELKAAGRKDSVQFAGLIKYSGQYQDEAPIAEPDISVGTRTHCIPTRNMSPLTDWTTLRTSPPSSKRRQRICLPVNTSS